MRYRKRWRTVRGILHKVLLRLIQVNIKLFTANMAKSYAPILLYKANQTIVDFLHTLEEFHTHNRRGSASAILDITYDRRVPKCDPLLSGVRLTLRGLPRNRKDLFRSGTILRCSPSGRRHIPRINRRPTLRSDLMTEEGEPVSQEGLRDFPLNLGCHRERDEVGEGIA